MYEQDIDETYSSNRSDSESDSSESDETMNTEDQEQEQDEDEEDEYETEEDEQEDESIITHVEWMDMLDPIPIINQKYYIGCYEYMQYDNSTLLLVNKIHRNTFMKFNCVALSKYFFWYSGVSLPKRPPIDILQLHITPDDTYTVIVKTFWIRIIQRTWKRIFKQRQEYIQWRKKLETIRSYELGKRNPPRNIYYQSIHGMLSSR